MRAILFILGCFALLLGVCGGLYLGFYQCLFMGIVNVVNACKATPLETNMLAWGVIRFLAAGLVGWGTFMLCFFISSFCFVGAASK